MRGIIYVLIMFIIVIIAFSFISIIGKEVWDETRPDIEEEASVEAIALLDDVENRYPDFIDGLIMFIFVGLWVLGLVLAYFSDSHPLLFGIVLIVLVFIIIAGGILGNFYEEYFEDDEYTGLTIQFPATDWICSHMIPIGIIIGLSIALVYYGKSRT